MATSLPSIVTAILLYKGIRGKVPGLFSRDDLIEYCKMAVAASVMGMAVYFLRRIMAAWTDVYGRTICLVLTGSAVYAGTCGILRVAMYEKILGKGWSLLKVRLQERILASGI